MGVYGSNFSRYTIMVTTGKTQLKPTNTAFLSIGSWSTIHSRAVGRISIRGMEWCSFPLGISIKGGGGAFKATRCHFYRKSKFLKGAPADPFGPCTFIWPCSHAVVAYSEHTLPNQEVP